MAYYSNIIKFGIISDTHYNLPSAVDGWGGPGGVPRRYSTASWRTKQAMEAFEASGVDFAFNNGDELQSSTGVSSLSILNKFRSDVKSKFSGTFYNNIGHHTSINFDPDYTGYNGNFQWSDYFNIIENDFSGVMENIFPGSGSGPYPLCYTFDIGGIRFVTYYQPYQYQGNSFSSALGPNGGDYGLEWLSNIALNTDLPTVVFAHTRLWSNDFRWGAGDNIFMDIFNKAGNVQSVFGGHAHEGTGDTEIYDIKCYHLRSAIITGITPDEVSDYSEYEFGSHYKSYSTNIVDNAKEDNSYYIFEIAPNVIWTKYGYKADIKISDLGQFAGYKIGAKNYDLFDAPYISKTKDFDYYSGILSEGTKYPDIRDNKKRRFKFESIDPSLSYAEININNYNYMVGDNGNNFIWDANGSNEHIFTRTNESIIITDGSGINIAITYKGSGSHVFEVQNIGIVSLNSTDIDATMLNYYKIASGNNTEVSRNIWYIDDARRHVFRIYSDFDAVDEDNKKIIVSPVEDVQLVVNTFSDKLNQVFDNIKIIDNGDGTESVELELDNRIVTIIIDQSGSMTWNDVNGTRHEVTKEIIQRISDNYPGEVFYNLIKYGALYANVIFFGLIDEDNLDVDNINTLSSLYFADTEANYAGIRVVRNTDHYPTSAIDGDIVSEGFISRILDDNLIENQTYYYTVYTYDNNYKFSSGVNIRVTPRTRNIPRGISVFNSLNDSPELGKGEPIIGSGAIRNDNTIALWHCDEGKGFRFYDFSDSKIDLVFNQDPKWLSESFVPAGESGVWFDGKSYASVVDTDNNLAFTFDSLSGYSKFTIMGWIYPYSVNTDMSILYRASTDFSVINYSISLVSGKLVFSDGINSIESPSLQSSVWQHFAITYDSDKSHNNVIFYINGIPVSSFDFEVTSYDASTISGLTVNLCREALNIDNPSWVNDLFAFNGKLTEISIHSTCRSASYISSQVNVTNEDQIDVNNGDTIIVTTYDGLKGDNGDRLNVLNYTVPEDFNFPGGEIRIVRKIGSMPSWEEDGDIVKTNTSVVVGDYYMTDADDFVHDEKYYYRLYTKNIFGNFSYSTDSLSIEIFIPSSDDMYFPDLSDPFVAPNSPTSGTIITPGNKKVFLKWSNTFSEDGRIERVRIYYSNLDNLTMSDRYVNGELIFSGVVTDEQFIHRNLNNNEEHFYIIVNVDKYGRSSPIGVESNVIRTSATPLEGLDESIIYLIDIENINYELVDNTSVSIGWDQPVKNSENIEAYFDQTVFLYASITDEFGRAVPNDTLVRLHIEANINKENVVDDVFTGTSSIEFNDVDAYEFSVNNIKDGIIKATLRMSTNPSIISLLTGASFKLQIVSYIPNNSTTTPSVDTGTSSASGDLVEIIEGLLDDIDGTDNSSASTSSNNIFEYKSQVIEVSFSNPWELELINRDDQKVRERCYYISTDDISGLKSLQNRSALYDGVYMRASAPFIARAKVKYKGEPVSSGTIDVAVWDAEVELCSCARDDSDAQCQYIGGKIQISSTVFPPAPTMDIVEGFEVQIDANGNDIQVPISYVDIPIYAPDMHQSVLLFSKATHAGFSSLDFIYIVFKNILKIDINAKSPVTNGIDVAEQKAVVYIIDPDFPDDKSRNTYPVDESVVQWDIEPIQKFKEFGLKIRQLSIIDRDKDLYSIDNVPIPNGVYSYTRSGTARNVFLGPISREEDFSTETHEIIASIVYNGLTAEDKSQITFGHGTQNLDRFGPRFLMEMEYSYKNARFNKIWTDGINYKKVSISRDPTTSSTTMSNIFRNCADEEGEDVLELNSSGQIVYVEVVDNNGSVDNNVEILYGDINEVLNEYTGEWTLEVGSDGFISYGFANIELNDEEISDITEFYIRVNKFCPGVDCKPDEDCDTDGEFGMVCLNLNACDLPGGNVFVTGLTTLFINGQPTELLGGGYMENGVPPCPICFREPLVLRKISTKINGVEIEKDSELLELTSSSVVTIKVEVLFRGDPVPDGTSLFVLINKISGVLVGNLFHANSNVITTLIEGDGRSYAEASITAVESYDGEVREQVSISTSYDEIEKTDRTISVSSIIGTMVDDVATSSDPPVPPIPPDPNEPEETKDNVFSNAVYRYNISLNAWERVVGMRNARGDAFSACVEDDIYFIGGLKNNFKDISAISEKNEKYITQFDEWENKEDMITPRYGGSSVAIGSKIYTIGGIWSNADNRFEVSDVVEVYDTVNDSWSSLSFMPNGVAFGTIQHVEISNRDYIYVLCGFSRLREYDSITPDVFNDKILRYSVDDNIWESSTVVSNNDSLLIYQRESPLSLQHNNKIVVFGGAWTDSKDTFIYPESEIFSIDITENINDYTEVDDSLDVFAQNIPIPKYYSSIAEHVIDPSASNADYYIVGGTIDVGIGDIINKSPFDVVEKINTINSDLSYENSYEIQDDSIIDNNPSNYRILSSLPVFKYGHSVVFCSAMDGSLAESPFVYVLGGYTTGLDRNTIVLEWENMLDKNRQKIIKCKLDGRQSVSASIALKRNNQYIDRDVNILVRGFLKFADSAKSAVIADFTESQEYQKNAASYLNNKTVVYPVLFVSKELVLKNGKGVITLMPRSEDILQDTATVNRRAQNFSLVGDTDIVETIIIKEDEELTQERKDSTLEIKIETGKIREPYKISVEVTILDSEFSGQTIDRGTNITTEKNDDVSTRLQSKQASNLIVDFYNDIDWIPNVESILYNNNDSSSITIQKIETMSNSVPFGMSTLYDAIVDASVILSNNLIDETRKLIYIFTDNDTSASLTTIDEAISSVNDIDGVKRVPLLVANLAIVEPVTMSVKANFSDTYDINKLSFLTGGQSVTLIDNNFTNDIVGIFYSSAVGSIGYGIYEFTVDLTEEVLLNSINPVFELNSSNAIASWTISTSKDGYNFVELGKTYSSVEGENEFDEMIEFTDKNIRYIRFFITLVTGFSTIINEYISSPESPTLITVSINYNKYRKVYLFLNPQEDDYRPYQMAISVDANEVLATDIKVGLAKSNSHNWIDYYSSSQPFVDQNGKIVVPIRFSEDITKFKQVPLNKIDKFTLQDPYGRWDIYSTVVIYDDNNNVIPSTDYKLYSREGLVVFNFMLKSDYKDGDYKISVVDDITYKVGLELTNKSTDDQLEIRGIGYMYSTIRDLLPPIDKQPPQATEFTITPEILNMYTPISLSYTYFDINYDQEDKSKAIIKWYINDVYIEYLDGYTKWNDVNDPNDPLFTEVFSFSVSDLDEGETTEDRARTNNESILKVGDNVHCVIKVSDGTLFSETTKSNIALVHESSPVVFQLKIIAIKFDGSETDRLDSSLTAIAKFNYYSDTGVNNSEITWFVDDVVFKKGITGTVDVNGLSYDEIVPGEYGLNTTLDLGLKIGNEIYVQVIPKSDLSSGSVVISETQIVQNSLPTVSNVEIVPIQPNENQDLTLTWNFFDFEIQALLDADNSFQSDKTGVQWHRKSPTGDWILIFDSSDTLPETFILEGYSGYFDNSGARPSASGSTTSVSILFSGALQVGEKWKSVIIPFDSLDEGEIIESNIVIISSST